MIARTTFRNISYLLYCLLFLVTACEQIATLRAQQYFNQAKKYYDEGNYSKAMETCDYALTFDPTFLDALTLKGMIYYQTGSYKNSLEWIRKAVTQKPDDKQLRMILIDALFKAERYESAIKQIQFLLANNPNDSELNFLYYYAHIKSRSDALIGKIQNELRTIINKGSEDHRFYCLVAELEILKGDLSQAKTILLEHYTPHPVWRGTMLLLADAFRANGDYANVVDIYNTIAEKADDKKA
ncbi:MAG: tetratricopeptide repeat protein, partial [Desulfobacterota bacterium]|nr:tetratricopeptide repeat protein [Thermodesulfobacteriota bacterium]